MITKERMYIEFQNQLKKWKDDQLSSIVTGSAVMQERLPKLQTYDSPLPLYTGKIKLIIKHHHAARMSRENSVVTSLLFLATSAPVRGT